MTYWARVCLSSGTTGANTKEYKPRTLKPKKKKKMRKGLGGKVLQIGFITYEREKKTRKVTRKAKSNSELKVPVKMTDKGQERFFLVLLPSV